MEIDLTNRTAVVTGSTAGIGFAIAKGLAGSGATLIALFLWLFRRYKKGNTDAQLAETPSSIRTADLGAGRAARLCTGDCT